MKPESLLALRQAVDERLSSDQVENILNSIENNSKGTNSGGLLKKISEDGIIDDIIEKLRGKPQPTEIPTHFRSEKEEQSREIDPRKRYLSVFITTGTSFIEQITEFSNG